MAFQGYRSTDETSTEELLHKVAREGWNEESAQAFVIRYDGEIKQQLLYQLMKLRFIKDENELRQLRVELYGR